MDTGKGRFFSLFLRLILIALAAALLTACSINMVGSILFVPPSAFSLAAEAPAPTSTPVPTIYPAATSQPTSAGPVSAATQPAAAPVSISSVNQAQLPLTVTQVAPCSPLAVVPLDELHRVISDPYHPPEGRSDARHTGVDFAFYRHYGLPSIDGVEIQSIFAGKVAAVLDDSFPYGNAVIIETAGSTLSSELYTRFSLKPGQSLYLLYAHMQATAALKLGDEVGACQGLGWVGMTGNAGAPHLHLETRRGPADVVFPGMRFYVPIATSEERLAYRLWALSADFQHFDPMHLLDLSAPLLQH